MKVSNIDMKKTSRVTWADNIMLYLPQCRTEFFKRSLRCYAIELWNSIPSDIRQAISLEAFKSKYFDFLLNFKSDNEPM